MRRFDLGCNMLRNFLACLCLIAASAASAEPAAVTPKAVTKLPVEAFAQIPFVERAKISPNGTRLAGLLGIGGAQSIAILNMFDTSDKPVRISVPDGTQANSVRWVNEDNIVVGLTTLLPVENDRWYVSRAIAISRKSGKITKLLWDSGGQNAGDILWIPSDGSNEILISAQDSIYSNEDGFWPTVYRVDVTTGRKRLAAKGHEGVLSWSADSAGNIRAGEGYDDSTRTSRLLYRAEGNGLFRTIDRADFRKGEGLHPPFMFLPGTSHGLVLHDDEHGNTGIYEYDLATQKDVKPIFIPTKGDVEGVILSADESALLGAYTSAQTDNLHWFDPKLAELQTQFDKAVPNANVRIESFSQDRTKMLVRVSSADMPGVIFYYDTAVGSLKKIAPINEQIGGKHLAPVTLVHYKARDGLEIEGILTLPAGRDPKKLPFIVLPHGGPWGQDTLGYDYWSQFLANRGYAVLQPNFRGSTGYGTPFVDKGKGQLGLAIQDDVTDGVKWAITEGIADPKRLCIVGASYGGYAAMWGVVKDPDLYRCAISISGVASLRRETNDFGNDFRAGLYRDQWKAMTPDFAAVSPLNATGRIEVPLLLIHGKKDVTVDHVHSAKMYAAMQKAGKAVEFVSVPLADHYFTRQPDRVTLLTAMESFLTKYNPAD